MADAAGHWRRAAELRLRENGVSMMLKLEREGVRTKGIWHFLAPTAQVFGLRWALLELPQSPSDTP